MSTPNESKEVERAFSTASGSNRSSFDDSGLHPTPDIPRAFSSLSDNVNYIGTEPSTSASIQEPGPSTMASVRSSDGGIGIESSIDEVSISKSNHNYLSSDLLESNSSSEIYDFDVFGLNDDDGEDVDKPFQVIKYEDGQFHLNATKMRKLLGRYDIKNRQVVVLSVSGLFRTGKTFLVNFFIKYLKARYVRHNIFNWFNNYKKDYGTLLSERGGELVTNGIWMWHEVFTYGKNIAIIVLDTQGIYSARFTTEESAEMLALTTLLSTIQCHNVKERLIEDDLLSLSLAIDYAMLAMKRLSLEKSFPEFHFVVRDWGEFNVRTSEDMIDTVKFNGQTHLSDLLSLESKKLLEFQIAYRKKIKEKLTVLEAHFLPFPFINRKNIGSFAQNLDKIQPLFFNAIDSLAPLLLFFPRHVTISDYDENNVEMEPKKQIESKKETETKKKKGKKMEKKAKESKEDKEGMEGKEESQEKEGQEEKEKKSKELPPPVTMINKQIVLACELVDYWKIYVDAINVREYPEYIEQAMDYATLKTHIRYDELISEYMENYDILIKNKLNENDINKKKVDGFIYDESILAEFHIKITDEIHQKLKREKIFGHTLMYAKKREKLNAALRKRYLGLVKANNENRAKLYKNLIDKRQKLREQLDNEVDDAIGSRYVYLREFLDIYEAKYYDLMKEYDYVEKRVTENKRYRRDARLTEYRNQTLIDFYEVKYRLWEKNKKREPWIFKREYGVSIIAWAMAAVFFGIRFGPFGTFAATVGDAIIMEALKFPGIRFITIGSLTLKK